MKYENKRFEIKEKEYESNFIEYRDEDEEGKGKYINEKLSKLPIHQLIKQIKLDELLWDFDAVSLYLSARWDEKSINPRIETGCAFKKDMNDERNNKFNNQSFNEGSAISKIKYYNPKNLIVQNNPVKERVKKSKLIDCEMDIV